MFTKHCPHVAPRRHCKACVYRTLSVIQVLSGATAIALIAWRVFLFAHGDARSGIFLVVFFGAVALFKIWTWK